MATKAGQPGQNTHTGQTQPGRVGAGAAASSVRGKYDTNIRRALNLNSQNRFSGGILGSKHALSLVIALLALLVTYLKVSISRGIVKGSFFAHASTIDQSSMSQEQLGNGNVASITCLVQWRPS